MALFKASQLKSAARGRASLLRLVLIWNRFDIAKQYLFSGDQDGEASSSATGVNKGKFSSSKLLNCFIHIYNTSECLSTRNQMQVIFCLQSNGNRSSDLHAKTLWNCYRLPSRTTAQILSVSLSNARTWCGPFSTPNNFPFSIKRSFRK